MSEPVPQRIGDAERDRAAEYLREHMSVGRLSQEEFDDRLGAALRARTSADLEPLFADLPAPKPGEGAATGAAVPWPRYPVASPAPTATAAAASEMPSSSLANTLAVVAGVAWSAWIIFCFAVGWQFWWLVFIPIVISSVADQQRKELKRREQLWQKQQNPQLPPGIEPDQPSA